MVSLLIFLLVAAAIAVVLLERKDTARAAALKLIVDRILMVPCLAWAALVLIFASGHFGLSPLGVLGFALLPPLFVWCGFGLLLRWVRWIAAAVPTNPTAAPIKPTVATTEKN